MSKLRVLATMPLALAMLTSTFVHAETATYPLAADVSSIDGLMKAYYDIVSGPGSQVRDVARDKSIHHPDARVFYPGSASDGSARVTVMSVEEYHRNSAAAFKEGFYEKEVERTVRQFGPSVHVWSTYESRKTPDGPVIARGINNLILLFDGKRYSILAETFGRESSDNPLPPLQANSKN
ncbi:hypothetical protein [Pseudoduganella violaceinigra]|uniref:hypothetical protein n=1 Tax=Pseudoduganella violaceinigra TaxID=246602 RepID=UPI0003F66AAB|nr:hypothetical protein [Pseudoduganella violaceinigra]